MVLGREAVNMKAQNLKPKFDAYQACEHPGRRSMKRSAVNIMFHFEQQDEPQVLMIKRAECEGDPWSGHMAFPGGRYEAEKDANMAATAYRETVEEVGVFLNDGLSLNRWRLSEVVTPSHTGPAKMAITPFVHFLAAKPKVKLNQEVAGVVWIPISFFLDLEQRSTMRWAYQGREVDLPCYYYQGNRIWGLSLRMLDEVCGIITDK